MSTIDVSQKKSLSGVTSTWTGLATGDDGSVVCTEGPYASVQVTGTFAGGSTVTMHGSNDGTNFVALSDQAVPANACAFTVAGFKGILQMPKYIKPVVTTGTGSGFIITLFNK